MTVGSETQRVGPGDGIFIPSGRPHGLKNDGDVTLRYVSAAAPAYEPGPSEKARALKSEAETASVDHDQQGRRASAVDPGAVHQAGDALFADAGPLAGTAPGRFRGRARGHG